MSAWIGLIHGSHALLSLPFGPHWRINEADAKAYGTALGNAMRHLPIKTTQKAIDFSALAMAIVTYDAPRVVMTVQLSRQQPPPRRGPAQVFQFVPPGHSPGANASNPPPQSPQAAGTQASATPAPQTPNPAPGGLAFEAETEAEQSAIGPT